MGLNKPIIPLLWQDCELHYRLASLQHIDLRGYRQAGLGDLVEHLRRIIPS